MVHSISKETANFIIFERTEHIFSIIYLFTYRVMQEKLCYEIMVKINGATKLNETYNLCRSYLSVWINMFNRYTQKYFYFQC
jgi:hypothetical protein